MLGVLKSGDTLVIRSSCRIVRPGILVTPVFSRRLLRVGARLINRRHHGAGARVRLLSGVNCESAESEFLFAVFHIGTHERLPR